MLLQLRAVCTAINATDVAEIAAIMSKLMEHRDDSPAALKSLEIETGYLVKGLANEADLFWYNEMPGVS